MSHNLLPRAMEWAAEDPDPETREELHALIAEANTEALAERFSGTLQFGTAGLRGPLGAGPTRMNRSVVIRAAAGIAAYLRQNENNAANVADADTDADNVDATVDDPPAGLVVIGYDARHKSDIFARDTASVMTGAGLRAALLPGPLPTPVLAFAIRHLGAAAGIMVTASHNPPQDNGYKVYLGDGAQIVPPVDEDIAALIAAVGPLANVPRPDSGWETLGDELVAAYLTRTEAALATEPGRQPPTYTAVPTGPEPLPPTPPTTQRGPLPSGGHPHRTARTVYTALHGVGTTTLLAAFERAGFPAPVLVPEQAEPDPDFPTVAFPNPEEPGAMDLAFGTARKHSPDLVIANDPDADRLAVGVPDAAAEGGWRMLRGDEVGALLAAHLVRGGIGRDPEHAVFATSIVSSSMLGAIAAAAGLRHAETLTGFKWLARVEELRYGYEEALGYCVDPEGVRDKDGITAALMVAELASVLKEEGRSLLGLLDDLAVEHGLHATDQLSVRVADPAVIAEAMRRLRQSPPYSLGGLRVARTEDLAHGAGGLPPTEGLRYTLEGEGVRGRIIVRPSGTEPKLKSYLEVVAPVPSRDELGAVRERAAVLIGALKRDLAATAGL